MVSKQFIVDEEGKKVGVLLDIEEYERVLAELEELESIRAFDQAKESGDEAVDFDQSVREIEQELC
jgi:PHD/YefM family antitoxin component YafN of YafNO toxin-antitoxin module